MQETIELIKISELARAAGVPVSTIHYYVQQGLLTPPVKTSRNMAYYDPHTVQEIKMIQELQAQKYLPLNTIKLVMQAKHNGQGNEHVVEMQSFLEGIYQPPADGAVPVHISFPELIQSSGLSESRLNDLQAAGFIRPQKTEQGDIYDDLDVRIARLIKSLEGWGLTATELDFYRQYIELLQVEDRKMHEAIHRLPDHDSIPLTDIFNAIVDLKKCLALKILREEAEHFNEHNLDNEYYG
jgi:DNA-binding transcriptional MerR regulator